MPRLVDLQKKLSAPRSAPTRFSTDEVLVSDARSGMTPGDFVEQKLRPSLQSSDSMKFATTLSWDFTLQGRSRSDEKVLLCVGILPDELSQRCDGRTMAVDFAIAAQGGEVGSSADRPAMDCECDFVSRSHGLPMAADASRISQLENGVYGVLAVAQVRRVEGQEAHAERRDRRQSVGSHGRRGNFAATTRARKSRAASDTSPSTRSV
jgi:hypothetical protein